MLKAREALFRAKQFEAAEKARKVADLEAMVRDFEQMMLDLDRQITIEVERTGIKDPSHFAYSMFAKSAAQRRENLARSLDDAKAKLEAARVEQEAAAESLRRAESDDQREDTRRRPHRAQSGQGSSPHNARPRI